MCTWPYDLNWIIIIIIIIIIILNWIGKYINLKKPRNKPNLYSILLPLTFVDFSIDAKFD